MFQILLFSLKNWIFNFKCVCQYLPQGLLRALEAQTAVKMLPDSGANQDPDIQNLM